MQISCPQCAAAYELDERVLPPGGAPVQCTGCSHVFTATPSARPAASGTQIFGMPQGFDDQETSEEPPPPQDRTNVYGRGQAVPPPQTQIFGAVHSPAPAPAAAPPQTQIFGAVHSPAPVPAAVPPQPQTFGAPQAPAVAPAPRTQIFGATTAPAPPAITAQTLRMPAYRPPAAADAPAPVRPRAATPMFGTPAAALDGPEPDPAPSAAPPPPARHSTPATTPLAMFNPPSLAREVDDGQDDPAFALVRSRRRRSGTTLLVIGLVILGLVGAAIYRELASRRPLIPEEAVTAHSEALRALRRDDPASLELSDSLLVALTGRYPDYGEARVTHLVSLLFRLADLKIRMERVTSGSLAINLEIQKLRERRSPSDWENRVNALIEQLKELKALGDPLAEQAEALDVRVNELYRGLLSGPQPLHPEDQLHAVRAQAVYWGVKGTDQAVVLSERYKTQGGTDGWGQIAYAEYALNARVAPETRRQARRELEALRATDSAWTRLYVMIGRLALKDGDLPTAINSLESALALNPQHQTARLLLEQARQR